MNLELVLTMLMYHLGKKDLELVRNLYHDDEYLRIKWKNSKDIFTGQIVSGCYSNGDKIFLASERPSATVEIKRVLGSNNLKYKTIEGSMNYSSLFFVNDGKLKIEWLSIYKSDAEKFLDHFKVLEKYEKKDVLKEVLDCEYTNEKVTEWLSEHETDLLREISFND